jgi:hypothetical protein
LVVNDGKLKGKLMVVGFVMIFAGLILLVYSDPALNAVVIGQSTSTTTTVASSAASSAISGFPGGFGGSTGVTLPSGTGATPTVSRAASSALSTDSIAENSGGFGLAAVGVILAIAGSRTRPN